MTLFTGSMVRYNTERSEYYSVLSIRKCRLTVSLLLLYTVEYLRIKVSQEKKRGVKKEDERLRMNLQENLSEVSRGMPTGVLWAY